MKYLRLAPSVLLSAALLGACSAQADSPDAAPQDKPAASSPVEKAEAPKPMLTTEKLADGFHVIFGPGGNVGVSSGEDGVVLIDDKFSRNAAEILERVREISDGPLLFVLNTHLHGDHTGSNPEMAEAGALIMAHENVRKRMGMRYDSKQWQTTIEPKDESFWPVVTFTDEASLHFNGVTARAIHIPNAHTDGDSIVHLEGANIIHMGDNFFNGMFPFVDVDSGGSVQGMIASHDAALALSDGSTVIVPGHGPISTPAELKQARDTLQSILDRVRVRKEAGKSLEEIIAEKPLADMAALDSFIKQDGMITAAWRSLGGDI